MPPAETFRANISDDHELTTQDVAELQKLTKEQHQRLAVYRTAAEQRKIQERFAGPNGEYFYNNPHELSGFGD